MDTPQEISEEEKAEAEKIIKSNVDLLKDTFEKKIDNGNDVARKSNYYILGILVLILFNKKGEINSIPLLISFISSFIALFIDIAHNLVASIWVDSELETFKGTEFETPIDKADYITKKREYIYSRQRQWIYLRFYITFISIIALCVSAAQIYAASI
ncbi:hypothetical protein DF185_07985 [Marinifilum breve]|uniref:Uncharacterized protein n=1 Tax=Marinifilum breve TaxID=2184082 RepID=A0A2V3ZXK2_9BACT|nr:hypothetical protein [Marinifilum breve]PXY01415.1 hypothetical protein DF185_07985 [Marinifilum breve]